MADSQNEELKKVLVSFLEVMDKQQSTLNRIERILMGAQAQPPQLVGSDFIFESMIRDINQLRKDIVKLNQMNESPE